MRTIAGAWYYGSGHIRIHQDASIMLLPQKPYLPMGSLQEALLYPHPNVYTNEQLQTILRLCLLDKFCLELDTVANWSQTLSLGEQQLLALGRVLLHKPDIICLDESTSALDEAKEAHIYACLREYLPQATLISVGHRSSLLAFHENHIFLDKQFQQNPILVS
jgi:putative ATP-binding cassette transporter